MLAKGGSVQGRGGIGQPPGCWHWPAGVWSWVVGLKCSARPVESCGRLAGLADQSKREAQQKGPQSMQTVIAATKLKDTCSLEE